MKTLILICGILGLAICCGAAEPPTNNGIRVITRIETNASGRVWLQVNIQGTNSESVVYRRPVGEGAYSIEAIGVKGRRAHWGLSADPFNRSIAGKSSHRLSKTSWLVRFSDDDPYWIADIELTSKLKEKLTELKVTVRLLKFKGEEKQTVLLLGPVDVPIPETQRN